eukprot:CAMPEP_0117616292 /NCGR_PEP_ID=MMETSP0784-20121206/84974_1 /TAXON_ID=39447 /ORGANISM="" /LENGTH=493 /DNA_ID=CAMNT_0005420043 /DNA_START=176 /DNA_END=1657 /DNA_ORIENTATION=+
MAESMRQPSLGHSASEPGLGNSGRLSSGSARNRLADVGASISAGNATTNLYEKMQKEGKFRDSFPSVRPAGRSTIVPSADCAERDVQPEVYFPAPPTPVRERRYRKISHAPGEIHVHYGLKDQRLPAEDFRYGIRGVKGATTEGAMKAGQLFGVAEYKNSVAERVYESTKKEPLGKPYIRGHNVKMLPEGFGNPSGDPEDAKMVIFPVTTKPDNEGTRLQYRKTHNNFLPGERFNRGYNWPDESKGENFRFGKADVNAAEGAGAKIALNMGAEDDGTYKRTRFVQKVNEDYRNVQHPGLMKKVHCKQGPTGPPLPTDHRYGVKSNVSDYTARSCIKGYYNLSEQLPDQDLGCCVKPGRRNVTLETRAFGIPSVRVDIPAPPPGARSIADSVSYGDECGCAALLNPQRFDAKGIPDAEFLVRRPRDELEAVVNGVNYDLGEDFNDLWEEAVGLFDDGEPMVSLDALLFVHQKHIDDQVARRLSSSSSAPQLRAR